MHIQRGQKVKLQDLFQINEPLQLTVTIRGRDTYDISYFGLSAQEMLEDDQYMIFYNQTTSPEGAMELALTPEGGMLNLSLAGLPDKIQKVMAVVCIDGQGMMDGIAQCQFALRQTGAGECIEMNLSGQDFAREQAIIGLEVYKRDNIWRVNGVARGFNGGLQALLESFGGEVIEAEKNPSQEIDSQETTIRPKVSLEKRLEKKAPALVSLAKPITLSLDKYQLHHVVAKVAVVMDLSGSMIMRYKNNTVQTVINKILPLAIQFDDDGSLDLWYYGNTCRKMEDVTLDNYEGAVPEDWRKLMNTLGGRNNEPPVLREVIDTFKDSQLPVYVLFVSDGGVSQKTKIKSLLIESSQYPIFWQFVGIGGSHYGIFEELDTMSGRTVDNAGFFAIDDFLQIENADLYDRLLSEFPQWLQSARQAGITH